MITDRANISLQNATACLLKELEPGGYWQGRLSASALSTATAVFALSSVDFEEHAEIISNGMNWLCENINADGGWGDTPESVSNIATTTLCWSALSIADPSNDAVRHTVEKTEVWLKSKMGQLDPESVSKAVSDSYGKDRTFAAPILTMCALSGRLGHGNQAWKLVPQLPFELAAAPRNLFRHLNMSVVSYALPALIAIGLVRHARSAGRLSPRAILRTLLTSRVLKILRNIQPTTGGFLEATPLTSFVVMSLAAAGHKKHTVTKLGTDFLVNSMREDGSWPIDSNLSVWLTTMSVKALRGAPDAQNNATLTWLLNRQYREVHPYTNAEPGGWGWSHLDGAVPDADDTAGALIALKLMNATGQDAVTSAENGISWLFGVQNRDGGIPTFCRGWGRLPFDQSCPDLTAHVIHAMTIWRDAMEPAFRKWIDVSIYNGLRFLRETQGSDGSWTPLWFGNQSAPSRKNPVFGTSLVLRALDALPHDHDQADTIRNMIENARRFLRDTQNNDGGWGGNKTVKSSIEETALAVEALSSSETLETAGKGVQWLITNTAGGTVFKPSPIGLYFASLWYDELLYPVIFTVSALRAYISGTGCPEET